MSFLGFNFFFLVFLVLNFPILTYFNLEDFKVFLLTFFGM